MKEFILNPKRVRISLRWYPDDNVWGGRVVDRQDPDVAFWWYASDPKEAVWHAIHEYLNMQFMNAWS